MSGRSGKWNQIGPTPRETCTCRRRSSNLPWVRSPRTALRLCLSAASRSSCHWSSGTCARSSNISSEHDVPQPEPALGPGRLWRDGSIRRRSATSAARLTPADFVDAAFSYSKTVDSASRIEFQLAVTNFFGRCHRHLKPSGPQSCFDDVAFTLWPPPLSAAGVSQHLTEWYEEGVR